MPEPLQLSETVAAVAGERRTVLQEQQCDEGQHEPNPLYSWRCVHCWGCSAAHVARKSTTARATERCAMASPCVWGTWDEVRGCYPCRTHAGGTHSAGRKFCTKAEGFWADLERADMKAFAQQLAHVRSVVESFRGWSFVGLKGRSERWTATGPAGEDFSAASPEELLAKVRAACGEGPRQGSLL